MKLSEQILRRPLFVAFGSSQQTGGLTSVDLEATRDDSQVILTASDGSAAPVAGADATTAGVMTAADKVSLDGLPPTTTREFAARAEIPGATIAAAITHLRSAGHAAAGDGGGAVYRRAGAEPAHALKVQSADGAWWEIVPEAGVISFIAAGGVEGDDSANGAGNVTAFDDFIGYVQTLNNGSTVYAGGSTLLFPQGVYHFNNHLNVKAPIHMLGISGSRRAATGGAFLKFAADSHGIIVHLEDTIDETTAVSGFSGAGAIIERLGIEGSGATTGHGIWMRAWAVVENCYIRNFAGNGYHIVADLGSGGATEGNANKWQVTGGRVEGCGGHGLFTDLADTNAGVALGVDCSSNGGWGFFDSSFLGNSYIACHAASNTLGAYKTDNANARNVFAGCYREPDQPDNDIIKPSLILGGHGMAGTVGNFHGLIEGFLYGRTSVKAEPDHTPTTPWEMVFNDEGNVPLGFKVDGDHPTGMQFEWLDNIGHWAWRHSGIEHPVDFTTNLNTRTYGRATSGDVGAGNVAFERGIWVGPGNDARHMTNDTAAPTTGVWARGDIVWNRSPSAGGTVGWVCVSGGSPGTWKTFGTIAA